MLRDHVPPASVAAVHVYFPDPWWKTRHHKRRVFTPEFAALVAGVLRPGGVLHIATDVGGVLPRDDGDRPGDAGLSGAARTRRACAAHDLDYLTNFERKAVKKGKPIYRAQFERTA